MTEPRPGLDELPETPCARCGQPFLAFTAQTRLCPACYVGPMAIEVTSENFGDLLIAGVRQAVENAKQRKDAEKGGGAV